MPLPAHGDGYVAERYKSPFVATNNANLTTGGVFVSLVAPFDLRVFNIALHSAATYNGTVRVRVNGTVVASVTVPSGSGGRVFNIAQADGTPVVANEGSLVEIEAVSGGTGSVLATVTFLPHYVPPSP